MRCVRAICDPQQTLREWERCKPSERSRAQLLPGNRWRRLRRGLPEGCLLTVLRRSRGPGEIGEPGSPSIWLITAEHGEHVNCSVLGSRVPQRPASLLTGLTPPQKPRDPTRSQAPPPPALFVGYVDERGLLGPVFLSFVCFRERLLSASSAVVTRCVPHAEPLGSLVRYAGKLLVVVRMAGNGTGSGLLSSSS